MDKTKFYSRCYKRKILRSTTKFFISACIFLMLCGCATNNTDVPGLGNTEGYKNANNSSDINSSSDKEALPTEEKNKDLQQEDKNDAPKDVEKNEDLRSSGIDLPLEKSRVIDILIESGYMGRKMRCKIYLPRGYGSGEAYPVWYGLHGYSSDESMWINQVGVAAASDELIDDGVIRPMIMVFPYTKDATIKEINKDLEDDGKFGERNMDRFICEELVPYMDSRYDTAASADDRYIGGFSMGGMIALRVAFHHPDLFSKAGGYSAAVISSDYSDKQLEEWLFPYDNVSEIADIATFDKEKGLDKLSLYLDCGTNNDPFLQGVRSLNDALKERGIRSEFHEYNGGHDLEHAKMYIKEYLEFYAGKH